MNPPMVQTIDRLDLGATCYRCTVGEWREDYFVSDFGMLRFKGDMRIVIRQRIAQMFTRLFLFDRLVHEDRDF